jgi:hypothetical protein
VILEELGDDDGGGASSFLAAAGGEDNARNVWVGRLTQGRRGLGTYHGEDGQVVLFVLLSKSDHRVEELDEFRGGIFQDVKVRLFLLSDFRSGTAEEFNVNLGIVDAARCWGRFFCGVRGGTE